MVKVEKSAGISPLAVNGKKNSDWAEAFNVQIIRNADKMFPMCIKNICSQK
jgi:hypothetical protein